MQVAVLDTNKRVLDPTTPRRARLLLSTGKAAVYRRFPFIIILKHEVANVIKPTFVIKLDPGSKKTGIAVVNQQTGEIVFACEVEHRGQQVVDNLASRRASRNSRRQRHTRYREARFLNRKRAADWLPPSLESRLANILTWVKKLCAIYPIVGLVMESVKFDTQFLENPEISGVEYQQGTLAGYEVHEYLLYKFGHKCCYCGKENVPLQIEHIVPKSRKGSNRVWNLCLACQTCNQKKGTMTAAEFGFPNLHQQAKQCFRDAAAVNSTRKKLLRVLEKTGLPIETGSGGLTKFNRTTRALPKTHWIDAACVGASTPDDLTLPHSVLLVRAVGHGSRQMCITDKHGKPLAHRTRKTDYKGWKTGDIARAEVPKGKNKGTFVGRVTIRQRNSFLVSRKDVNCKYLVRLHRKDGYEYEQVASKY